MAGNYLNIQSVSDGYEKLVKQELKFKTGNFIWKISFNIPLNPATVNNSNLSVMSESNRLLETKITYDSATNCIEIEPLEPYAQGESYILHITKNVESRGGQRLKDEIDIKFML